MNRMSCAMLRCVVFVAVLTFLFAAVHPALAQSPSAQPTTQQTSAEPRRLYEDLSETELAKILEGRKQLTWDDVRTIDFWKDTIRNLGETLGAFIPRLIGTLIFLFVFWLIYRGVRKMAMGNMKSGEVDSSIRDLLGALIKWLVMGFGVVIACNQLGIPIVAMLTGVSLIGLAVGFAAQETLANFIAGIVIFLDKPLKINDWIEIDSTFGQVKRVTFRATRILTLDGEIVVLPNTQVLSTKLTNHSTHPINRVNIPIGIAYKSSIDEARSVLLGLIGDDRRVMKEPAPEVIVKELADSSVNLVFRFWISDAAIERRMISEYTEKAKKAFDSVGIEIPFPHLQLFIENTPAVAALAGNGKARGAAN